MPCLHAMSFRRFMILLGGLPPESRYAAFRKDRSKFMLAEGT